MFQENGPHFLTLKFRVTEQTSSREAEKQEGPAQANPDIRHIPATLGTPNNFLQNMLQVADMCGIGLISFLSSPSPNPERPWAGTRRLRLANTSFHTCYSTFFFFFSYQQFALVTLNT